MAIPVILKGGEDAEISIALPDGISYEGSTLVVECFGLRREFTGLEPGGNVTVRFSADETAHFALGTSKMMLSLLNDAGVVRVLSWAKVKVTDSPKDVFDAAITPSKSALELAVENVASALESHAGRTDNPHAVTKAQVGLGNADDTADADKPVSTAQAAAIKAVSAAVDAEAARAEKAEATKADKTTVTALTTRVSSVESKKADKTTVATLSSSVDTLKSSKRGTYDLAVYRRAVSVQLKKTAADNSDGTVLGTSETGVYCTFVKSSVGTETYRGQFGENSYLSLTLVVEGGEIVGGAYGKVEVEGESATITNLTYEGNNRVTGSTTLTLGSEFVLYEVKGTVENDTSTSNHGMLLTTTDKTELVNRVDALEAKVDAANAALEEVV